MSLSVRNLAWLRSLKIEGVPDAGARLHEIVQDLMKGTNTLEQQTNSNLDGVPAPPPRLQAMTVTPTSVGHHVSINHGASFYRGIYYHVETSDNAHFSNPFPAYSGPAREIDLATGAQKLYFRSFASYQNSDNTTTIFHGGSVPQPVTGGTHVPRGVSQGSGTGRPGEGVSGFGTLQYRGNNPPERGK